MMRRLVLFPFLLAAVCGGDAVWGFAGTYKAIEGGSFDPSTGPVRYALDPAGSHDIPDDADLLALRSSFRAWACVEGTSLRFSEDDEPGPAVVDLTDGRNSLFWDETGAACLMGPGTLGVTIGDANGTFRAQADICFNGADHGWTTDGNFRDGQADVGSIATHEIGHFIGLDHPCDGGDGSAETNCNGAERSVMTPVWNNEVFRRPLADDEEGLRSLYPADDSGSGCEGPFGPGERCGCDDDCVTGLLCVSQPDGDARCAAPCRADAADCGVGATCVLSSPGGGADSAGGVCVAVVSDKPAGAVCNLGTECGSGTCSTLFSLGQRICVVACEKEQDCAGGGCHEGICLGSFDGQPCAAEQGGCGCQVADRSPNSAFSATFFAAILTGVLVLRMRGKIHARRAFMRATGGR